MENENNNFTNIEQDLRKEIDILVKALFSFSIIVFHMMKQMVEFLIIRNDL